LTGLLLLVVVAAVILLLEVVVMAVAVLVGIEQVQVFLSQQVQPIRSQSVLVALVE
jgi:hypothetical protein